MSEYVSYFRPELDDLSGYQPGEQPKVQNLVKLNTNENPYPPAPEVQEVLRTIEYENLRLYPDPLAVELRTELGKLAGLPCESVIVGNGSDDILTILFRCFTGANRPVACMTPSYSLYPTLAALQGAPCIQIPLNEDFSLPDDLLAQAERANMLIFARPNAPTGNLFPKPVMEEICRSFHGIVVIDEAYADFATDNCVDFVAKYSNVVICRTFSKSRSLAGLRLGYAFAHPKIIEGMIKMKDSYNVSRLTQALALASLKNPAYFADTVAKIRLAREMLFLGLLDLGFFVIDSQTNFLFASPPDGDGERYFQELRKRNIIVRYFPGPVTGKFVRISIGTFQNVMDLFLLTRKLYPCKDASLG